VLHNQESFAEESTNVSDMASGQTSSLLDSAGSSKRSNERMHSVDPSNDVPSLTFHLMRVQGLPSWANSSSVTVQDVIQVHCSFNLCDIIGVNHMLCSFS